MKNAFIAASYFLTIGIGAALGLGAHELENSYRAEHVEETSSDQLSGSACSINKQPTIR